MMRREAIGLTVTLGVAGQLGDIDSFEISNIGAIDMPIKPGDEITFRVISVTRKVVER